MFNLLYSFFFFQAEDGIRVWSVTGVQTCALPIYAACCRALGERSRGEDHGDATKLVEQVAAGGGEAAKALGRLLAIKNDAEYGLKTVSRANRELAIRQARKLLKFAEAVVDRDAPDPFRKGAYFPYTAQNRPTQRQRATAA